MALRVSNPTADDTEVTALSTLEESRVLTVTDKASAEVAAAFIKTVKSLEKKIKDTFGPLKKAASAAHKKIVAEEKRFLAPLKEAGTNVNGVLAAWLAAEKEKVLEAERAERRRMALEEQARRLEEEKKVKEAVAAEQAGEPEKAQEILTQPVAPVAAPPVLPEAPEIKDTHVRETWSAEVVDFVALISFISLNPVYGGFLLPNSAALNERAREKRTENLGIPGVRGVKNVGVVTK